jgi:hypothetical protein
MSSLPFLQQILTLSPMVRWVKDLVGGLLHAWEAAHRCAVGRVCCAHLDIRLDHHLVTAHALLRIVGCLNAIRHVGHRIDG